MTTMTTASSIFEQFFGSVSLWARAFRTFLATFFATLGALPLIDTVLSDSTDGVENLLLKAAATGIAAAAVTLGIGLAPSAPDPNASMALTAEEIDKLTTPPPPPPSTTTARKGR